MEEPEKRNFGGARLREAATHSCVPPPEVPPDSHEESRKIPSGL